MRLQILGKGCSKCELLARHVEAMAKELGLDYELEKVTDINAIIEAGVMSTPALAVDGVVKSSGRVPTTDEIRKFLGG